MDPALIYLFFVFFLLAFVTDVLPFIKSARNIAALSQSSLKIIQSADIDDDQKQSALLKNSLGIFKESFKITVFTAILVGLLLLSLRICNFFKPLNYDYLLEFMISLAGVLLSVFAFVSYFVIKKIYGRFRV